MPPSTRPSLGGRHKSTCPWNSNQAGDQAGYLSALIPLASVLDSRAWWEVEVGVRACVSPRARTWVSKRLLDQVPASSSRYSWFDDDRKGGHPCHRAPHVIRKCRRESVGAASATQMF